MKPALYFLGIITALFPAILSAQTNSSALATANNSFAFKLLKELSSERPNQNLFLSPYSAAVALEMAANGAAGQTRTEMQQVLETTGMSAAEVGDASRAAAAALNANTNLVLSTANALWYRQGAAIKQHFLDENGKYFSAAIKAVDFENPSAAEAEISQWASDETHGRIRNFARGMVDPATTDLILANAIYFKGGWQTPFDPRLTHPRAFHPLTGRAGPVPMMQRSGTFDYRKGNGYQAVRLPYVGDAVAMYVLLPEPGSNPDKLLQTIKGERWQRATLAGFNEQEGLVVLPKIKLETTTELRQPLMDLGMKSAFMPGSADFRGMFADPHHLSEVRQKAFVEVDEQGTEAAAVTGVAVERMALTMNRPKPFEMIMDRPFLLVIADARSQMILFLGMINQP